jgi:hypothetical protein
VERIGMMAFRKAHSIMKSWRYIAASVAAPLLLGAVASPAFAQRTHVILIQGLSGEPSYGPVFKDALNTVALAAKASWNVPDGSLILLTEDGAGNLKSSRENVMQAFTTIGGRAAAGDVVLVMLVGHGGGEGPTSRVNLPGPDPTAADFATYLSGFSKQRVVFVNASSGSGDFLPVIAGPQRVVVTATKSAMQKNESVFAMYFSRGLTSSESDADKDGRVSVLEAFNYAKKEVKRVYETSKRMQTEQAQLSDSSLARAVAFGGAAASTDPKIAALVGERQELEAQVGALRLRKDTMSAAEYDKQLETLLLSIAEKTRAIRAAGGRE